jgi:hypothetical protein
MTPVPSVERRFSSERYTNQDNPLEHIMSLSLNSNLSRTGLFLGNLTRQVIANIGHAKDALVESVRVFESTHSFELEAIIPGAASAISHRELDVVATLNHPNVTLLGLEPEYHDVSPRLVGVTYRMTGYVKVRSSNATISSEEMANCFQVSVRYRTFQAPLVVKSIDGFMFM